MIQRLATAAACLGCGCLCDDIDIVVSGERIVEARRACALGTRWFGDGVAPARVLIDGQEARLSETIELAARLLLQSARPRIVLGANVSCETYREAVACADALRARVDIAPSSSWRSATLAVQQHGMISATLGEIRNRADVVVFWAVDPTSSYPRFQPRYAPGQSGILLSARDASRTIVAVHVGTERGPADADVHVEIAPGEEGDVLTTLAAVVGGSQGPVPSPPPQAVTLAAHLQHGRYVALVVDCASTGEPPRRLGGLLDVTRALNGTTRGALCLLRGAGNLCGAEAVLTRQTGYPDAVDFAAGEPRYAPHEASTRSPHDVTLLVGTSEDPALAAGAPGGVTIAIGPRASARTNVRVTIDTAVAGIHGAGTAVRMDGVTLPVREVVAGPPDATRVLQDLLQRLP